MKRLLALSLLTTVAALSGLAFSQDPVPAETTEKRIERLEKELVATRERTEALFATLTQTREQVDGLLKYIATQADASKNLARALDESELAGFTYGINPDSRKILLAGWREQLATMQK